MIAKLFSYWKKSKEQQAAICVLKLEKILDDIGREPVKNEACSSVQIYRFTHRDLYHLDFNGSDNRKTIQFNKRGEIIK